MISYTLVSNPQIILLVCCISNGVLHLLGRWWVSCSMLILLWQPDSEDLWSFLLPPMNADGDLGLLKWDFFGILVDVGKLPAWTQNSAHISCEINWTLVCIKTVYKIIQCKYDPMNHIIHMIILWFLYIWFYESYDISWPSPWPRTVNWETATATTIVIKRCLTIAVACEL